MYKSPIDIFYGQIETQIEGEIMKVVQKVHVNVDKDELLRALQYDRDQYEKGYADGKRDATDSIVRCKDCAYSRKHQYTEGVYVCEHPRFRYAHPHPPCMTSNEFCSCGERRTDDLP